MSVQSTVASIDSGVVSFAPAVIAGILAAEVSSASGSAKAQAVIDGIQQGSQALAQNAQPDVAAIAGMVNLFVSIFNALGVLKHKTP